MDTSTGATYRGRVGVAATRRRGRIQGSQAIARELDRLAPGSVIDSPKIIEKARSGDGFGSARR